MAYLKSKMVAIASYLPGASFATTGTVAISGASYIIPVSALNGILTPNVIGTGDSVERLYYALLAVLNSKCDSGAVSQPTLGCEVSAKSITKNVYEVTTNVFSNVNIVSFLASFNLGTNSLGEDPSNLQVV